MPLPDGSSKDHRPDLNQAVLALRVAPDGGGPWVRQRWAGNASETKLCQERAAALLAPWQRSPPPRALGADANREQADKAANRNPLGFITPMPPTRTWVSPGVTPALHGHTWERLADTTGAHRLAWCPDGRAQRWRLGSSQAALERAEAPVSTAGQRASEALKTHLWPGPAQRGATPAGANAALAARENPWTSHQGAGDTLIEPPPEAHPGRPTHTTPITSMDGQMHAQLRAAHQQRASHTHPSAGCVVGSPLAARPLREPAVMAASQGPAQAEGGVRLRQEPRLLVASWCVQQPGRMHGRLRVLTFALRGSAVTPRRRRHPWAHQGETGPHQSHHPTARPTWRWVFPRREGMQRVRVTVPGQVHALSDGLNEVPINSLRFCGAEGCRRDQMSPA
jgi:hypothetical protein